MWVLPLVVLLLGRSLSDRQMLFAVAAGLGVLLVAWGSRRPEVAVVALVGGFPLAEIVLPWSLRVGVPAPLVRAAGSWKELLVAALVVAAVTHRRAAPSPPDRLELLALGFVALVGVYLVFPTWLAGDGLAIPDEARNVAARTLAVPVIALVAARHVPLSRRWRQRVLGAAVLAGVVVGLGAVVEITSPGLWQRFLHDGLDVNGYQRRIFSNEAERTFIFSDPTQTGGTARRAASIFGSHLDSAFALLLPLAVVLHRLSRGWRSRTLVQAGIIGAGLALTQTRSALLGGALLALGALRGARLPAAGRTRLMVGMALAAVVLVPLVADSALGDRITGAVSGSDVESTPTHTDRSRAAFDAVVDDPLGRGLGSSGGIANRFGVVGGILPENHYLRVALDLGVVGGALFLAAVVTAARQAHRRFVRTGAVLDAAAAGAATALAVVGLLLDSFDAITSAVPLMVVLGLATSTARAAVSDAPASPVPAP